MSDPNSGISPGEIGGVFAGITALIALFGAGIKWLLNWNDARANSRSAKLQAWHDELSAREAKLDADIEKRLATIERQNSALRYAFHHVASALMHKDPQNPALAQAEQVLAAAFPIDFQLLAEHAGAAVDHVAGA